MLLISVLLWSYLLYVQLEIQLANRLLFLVLTLLGRTLLITKSLSVKISQASVLSELDFFQVFLNLA